jgi:hypothetical protein
MENATAVDSGFRYDAFVSYSTKDRDWVTRYLLPPLEQNGLKIAIDFRDFDVGRTAMENMRRFLSQSRHVIYVMSPAWLESDWTAYEDLLTAGKDPAGRRRRIIPILISKTQLPEHLSARTYANLSDPALYQTEMTRVVRAIADDDRAPAATVQPALPEPQPTLDWKAELAELLVRSGQATEISRRALCLQIGIDPSDLDFLTAAPRAFAVQLSALMAETENFRAALSLCEAIRHLLHGSLSKKLEEVESQLRSLTGN